MSQNNLQAQQEIFKTENSNQGSFGIDPAFVHSINFYDLSSKWFEDNKFNGDLKILRIKMCPSLYETATKLTRSNLSAAGNLFVIVLEFITQTDNPTAVELRYFSNIFNDNRPAILQFNTPRGTIYVKDFMDKEFTGLSCANNGHHTQALKEMLEVHGNFNGDILSTRLSPIEEHSKWSECMAASILCLRVSNLFVGGCSQTMPLLEADFILDLNHLKALLAFIDYPFDPVVAVQEAWRYQRYDLLEAFIARDSPFPAEFKFKHDKQAISEDFKRILLQRKQLHRSIATHNINEVVEILKTIEEPELKRAYNESNDSVMATALKNFNPDMYTLLLQSKFKFCKKSKSLLMKLSEKAKHEVAAINWKFFTQLEAGPQSHPLLSKCLLATGHYHLDYYRHMLDQFFSHLENLPEIEQVLKFVSTAANLRIVIDFKHDNLAFMDPRYPGNFSANGVCISPGIVYISAIRMNEAVCGTIAHELTHFAMEKLYKNGSKPYPYADISREQEYATIVSHSFRSHHLAQCHGIGEINAMFSVTPNCDLVLNELIVYVPQMIAEYSEFEVAIASRKKVYEKLFEYYSKYIARDLHSALAVSDL